MAGRFSVEAVFKAVDRLTAPVNRMQNRMGKFTRSMNSGITRLNRNVDKISGGMRRAGFAIVASLGIAGGAMAKIIGTGAEFEQTLVNAAAKFPGMVRKGTDEFAALEAAARKAGSTTEFTASQAAQGLDFLAMAGFNLNQSIAALPGIIDLATAANVDLASASDIATDALGAYGLATKDPIQLTKNLTRVSDVLAKTATTANTDMARMYETIAKGAPTASSAGVSMEEFSAMAGIMAGSTLKASEAGSVLKNTVLRLAAPTAGAQKVMRRLGLQTQDADGNLRNIVDILQDLEKSMESLGTAEKSAVLNELFGKRAITGVDLILKAGTDTLRAYTKELEAAGGASKEMATVMRDTLMGRLNSLKSAIEGVQISIFMLSNEALNNAVDKMTEWVRANEKLIASNIGNFLLMILNNMESIVKWTKRIAIGIGVFIAFTAILKTFVLVMTALNLVMALNPIGLMVIGVAALIAGFTLLIQNIDSIAAGFKNLHPILRLVLAPLELIVTAIKKIKDAGEIIGGRLGKALFNIFGDSGNDDEQASTNPQIVSPQERTARSIEENTSVNRSEVTIKPDEGTNASVTKGKLGGGLTLQPSGGID